MDTTRPIERPARAPLHAPSRPVGEGALSALSSPVAQLPATRMGRGTKPAPPTALGSRASGTARSLAGPGLTRRELQVLRLLAEGPTDTEIAAALSISTRTVETHVARILAKLGCPTRTAAATYAVRHALV